MPTTDTPLNYRSQRHFGRLRIERYLAEMAGMPADWWTDEHRALLRRTADRIAPAEATR